MHEAMEWSAYISQVNAIETAKAQAAQGADNAASEEGGQE